MDFLPSWLTGSDVAVLVADVVTFIVLGWAFARLTGRRASPRSYRGEADREPSGRLSRERGVEIREGLESGDIKALRDQARQSLEAQGDLAGALERLEAEIQSRFNERSGLAPQRADGSVLPRAADHYRVWYATNRKPVDPADTSRGYSGRRDRMVHHGYCDVFVPKSHKIGSVGSSTLHRLLTWTDDRLTLRTIAGLEGGAFWDSVAAQIAELEAGKRHAVVFIHGYNVSFEEAAIRAAQIGFDLGIGAMALFSWPSKGRKTRRAYESDGQTIGASEAAIADFLVGFARRSGAEAVHVIVHSMGNQGVMRAMNAILADAQQRSGCRFGQFILAAADVDAETFERLTGAYKQLASRTTLYVSERDLALKTAAWLAEYPRVGLYPPVSVFDGIDTVSVSNVDLTLLGHGYVGEAREVLGDMHRLIFDGVPPPRFGLRPRQNDEGKTYWEVGA